VAAGFQPGRKQKQWISNLRSLYRFLPFARCTYRDAAMQRPSSQVPPKPTPSLQPIARSSSLFQGRTASALPFYTSALHSSPLSDKLELIFVGSLVPYKACDLALRGGHSAPANGQGTFHHCWRWP
jgi:hypothetical protein